MRSRLEHHLTSCAVRVAGLYHELRQRPSRLPRPTARRRLPVVAANRP